MQGLPGRCQPQRASGHTRLSHSWDHGGYFWPCLHPALFKELERQVCGNWVEEPIPPWWHQKRKPS